MIYHCDHFLQGPHGHQGKIKVVVKHSIQQCVAYYDGSHTGMSTDGDQPGDPVCSRTS